LNFATGKRHTETVQALLEDKDLSTGREEIFEALMRAALIGHTTAVRALLDRGAEVNRTDQHGWSPLMEAVFGGHAETIGALIERGADVNTKDRAGWTPLMEAASKGHTEIVKTLLAGGADVNARNIKRWTALKAAPRANFEIVRLLKAAGAEN
jgi:ankyrin repeat protein